MAENPLLLGEVQREQLRDLRERAALDPTDMRGLGDRLKDKRLKREHVDRMNNLSIELPLAYLVTFTVEVGHPGGVARHLSMSSKRRGKTPIPEAVWMVCQELGFVGDRFEGCTVWVEDLQRGPDPRDRAKAVNVVQLVSVVPSQVVAHSWARRAPRN